MSDHDYLTRENQKLLQLVSHLVEKIDKIDHWHYMVTKKQRQEDLQTIEDLRRQICLYEEKISILESQCKKQEPNEIFRDNQWHENLYGELQMPFFKI